MELLPAAVPGPFDGERGGVRARWLDLPGTVVGTWTFGVGAADEPPHLAGITHLAEHLLFRTIGEVGHRANGATGPDTVTFYTAGTSQEVAAFLGAVAGAVRDCRFTVDDLVRELHVIRAERPGGDAADPGLLTYRYGLGGLGVTGAGWPALPSITVDEVRDWVRYWFVAGNAVLTSTAPLPEDLAHGLPAGQRPRRTVPEPLVRVPTLVASPKNGVAASLLVPAVHATVLRECLERELHDELRGSRALIYSVHAHATPVGAAEVQLDLVLDPVVDDVAATVDAVVTTLRRLAEQGIRAEVLAQAVASIAARRHWWSDPVDQLDAWAEATLLGRAAPRTPDEEVAHARTATAEGLSGTLAAALGTLVVVHEEGPDLVSRASALGLELDEGLPWHAAPRAHPVPRSLRWHRGRGEGRGARMAVDGADLWGRVGDDLRWLPLADVVVVARDASGAVQLVDRRGRGWPIDPADWRRGDELVGAVLAGASRAVVRDATWPDRGRAAFARRAEGRA